MENKKSVTPTYSFDQTAFVKFVDRSDFRLAKYFDISLTGFSCFCPKPMEIGEKHRIEINLKMISGGTIDDLEPHIAMSELTACEELDGKKLYRFNFIEFEKNCFDNLIKAIEYLDQKEKLISVPDLSKKKIDTDQKDIEDIVKDVMESIKNGEISLPVLPHIVQEVEKVVNSPTSTIEELAEVIEKDAVISVKVVSTANSPFYRGKSHIVTVKDTIPRLGFKETQNLVVTIANKSLYNAKNRHFKKLLEKLWLHSLACACSARAIAEKLGLDNTDKFFMLGLVHDIGKTLLLRILSEIENKQKFSTEKTISIINEYSPSLCGVILRHWKFSKGFVRAVVLHEGPTFDKTADKATLVINIANNLARSIGYDIGGSENINIDLTNLDSVKRLKISMDTLNEIAENTKAMMQDSDSAF